MRLCRNLAVFLVLAWLAPCDSARREKERERKKDKTVVIRGNVSALAGERCTWAITEERQPLHALKVTCPWYTCVYNAVPELCPRYDTRTDTFWFQIIRAIQRQKQHLCKSAHIISARMCKSAPAVAHFRFVKRTEITMTTPASRAGLWEVAPTTECTRSANHQELAQEKCGNAWASFCNFLFNMVQSRDC